MLTIAKTVAHGSFGFNTEIVVRTLVFVKKCISATQFLSETQWNSDNFDQKQKGAVPWTHRELAGRTTLPTPLTFEPLSL